MSNSSDNTLELLIQFKADLEAAAKSREELLEMRRQATAMGVSTAGLDEELAKLDKNIAVLGKKTLPEAQQNVGKLETRSRDLHKITGALNDMVPGLGTALRVAFNPTSIGIVGLLAAFAALKDVLGEIQAIDQLGLPDFKGTEEEVKAVKNAYENAAVAAQLFIDEQKRLNSAGVSADEVARRQIQNFQNLVTAQEQYDAASRKLAEAPIDYAYKNGLISHKQYTEQKFALDVEYARKKLMLEAEMDRVEQVAKAKQLETERTNLSRAVADQKTDQANAAATAAAKSRHETAKENAKSNIASAGQAIEELGRSHGKIVQGIFSDETAQQLEGFYEKYIGSATGKRHSEMFAELEKKRGDLTASASWSPPFNMFMDRTVGRQEGEVGWAKYDLAKTQMSSAKRELAELDKKQFQVELNSERAAKQLAATDEAIRTMSASVQKLNREIPQQAADAAAKLNNNAAIQNISLRASAVESGLPDPGNIFVATQTPVASAAKAPTAAAAAWRYDYSQPRVTPSNPEGQARNDFAQASRALDVLNSGGKLDANQNEQLRIFTQMATGHAVRSDQTLAVLRQIFSTQQKINEAFERELGDLKSQFSNRH